METSPSEDDGEPIATEDVPAPIRVEPEPTPEEAAAIAAAIRTQLLAGAASASDEPDSREWWRERRWRLHGRLREQGGTSARPPVDLPTDPWRAAARTDRF